MNHKNISKKCYDHIYNLQDPRNNIRELSDVCYKLPQFTNILSKKIIEYIRNICESREIRVFDVCCSYGINSMVINHRLTWDEIISYYTDISRDQFGIEEKILSDGLFFEEHRIENPYRFTGLDIAPSALNYGIRTGLLANAFCENLEVNEPTKRLQQEIQGADLILMTGALSYVWTNTIDRILGQLKSGQRYPVVAFSALRTTPAKDLIPIFQKHGYDVSLIPGTFVPQRRYSGNSEKYDTLEHLRNIGLYPLIEEIQDTIISQYYVATHKFSQEINIKQLLYLGEHRSFGS